ncbi:MAG: hypothetical protein UDK34_01955 [Cyanobacteriota bacterium]|nr:hypothetical protein [Cyanobacteriota bacterium]
MNKIINKITYKILTLFIFNRSKRHKIKEKFFKLHAESELNEILSEYKDYWIFSLFFPWGDLGIACSLIKEFKKVHGGKVLVLINSQNRADVVKLFPSIDKFKVVSSDVYDYIFRYPNLKIEKGKYFEINHWKFYNAPRYKSKHFLELYARMMNIENWNNFERPEFGEEIKNRVLNKIKELNIDIKNTVFISKDSNSFDCTLFDENFWIKKAKEFEANGYEVVFNSKKRNYNGYKTIYLPMAEQLYFCSQCAKIVAVRSGFNDLLGIMGLDNLEIYYPKSMFFKTISQIEQLVEFKRAFLDEEYKTFDENMYRITSMKMFSLKNVNEITTGKVVND